MAIDFNNFGYENLFREALRDGINLFCGAGFSVEAEDKDGKKLPTGFELLNELKKEFQDIANYTKLPRACTKLIQTDKAALYTFLENRFSVKDFSDKYLNLLKINIKNVYTTNIDDLFFELYKKSDKLFYINDRSIKGEVYEDELAINYYPLHGCIRTPGKYVFGTTEIACAFLQKDIQKSWRCLAEDASQHPILFWGWNFEDPGPIEAMYGNNSKIDENINKWVLLYKKDDEMIDYLRALKFNIIIGSTKDMLEFIEGIQVDNRLDDRKVQLQDIDSSRLKKYEIPPNDKSLPSYPLNSFFLDYIPRWSHIYSGEIPKLSHYTQIADHIASQKKVIVIGMRGSGKTTLLMQLMADLKTNLPKHFMVAPTLEQIQVYLKILNGRKSILFVDDCFRDTAAIRKILECSNIEGILFDRDFNYERQFHKIQDCDFVKVDITEISLGDAQSIKNIIPNELKRNNKNMKKFKKDPTLLNLLGINLKSINFNFINDFQKKDLEAAKVFLVICYVHACGVPCSFDMIYSFLGDEKYTWKEMYEILGRVGGLIKECSAYFGTYDIIDSIQDYYQCRSRHFAQTIIESIPKGNSVFSQVLFDFATNVPIFKICQYDKFKRSGYDADFTNRAFLSIKEGEKYYKICAEQDESEYIYQQAAIYFSRNNDYKLAFQWIDKARNMAHYNRFSIDSTYAQLYFDVNLENDRNLSKKALDILGNCCMNDKRKAIHFSAFAKRVIKFYAKYNDSDSRQYAEQALQFIKEGLEDTNLALSQKNKWELIDLKDKLNKLQL